LLGHCYGERRDEDGQKRSSLRVGGTLLLATGNTIGLLIVAKTVGIYAWMHRVDNTSRMRASVLVDTPN
jgi:hypothetical protein